MVGIQGQVRNIPDQRFDHLIGRLNIVKAMQRNSVLNSGVMGIKGNQIGNTDVDQFLQHHGAVQGFSGAPFVLSAFVQHGHHNGDSFCLSGDGADDPLQVRKVLVGRHGHRLTVHFIGHTVIEHIVSPQRLINDSLSFSAPEPGAGSVDHETMVHTAPLLQIGVNLFNKALTALHGN